ncbi:dTMP kinase [Streptomyces chartreusis]|uniref:dTMP kinase n=1 Tax=Streptomyces chartreusis TaxID=1969 RepID=UPI0033FE1474
MTAQLPSPYRPLPDEGEQGPLIVLEGVSGVGKSTLRATLAKQLGAASIHTLSHPHTQWSDSVNCKLRPLPQFGFYLSGLLHASDSIRMARSIGPVIADRYTSSVLACHAAVHHVPLEAVRQLMEPYRSYLTEPTHTFYLSCSAEELRRRIASKDDLTRDDAQLLEVKGRLTQLLENFAAVAQDDPTAVLIDTDAKSSAEVADLIAAHLEKARAQSH